MTKLNYQDQLHLAVQVAARAHQGQKRKDGTPYIAHPMKVALRVANMIGQYGEGMNIDAQIAAFLHDVVEDTEVTIAQLRELGFSEAVLAAIDAVTKRPGESYLKEFIPRIASSGPIAIAVKLADIEDNLEDQSALDEDEAKFLKKRYTEAKRILQETL